MSAEDDPDGPAVPAEEEVHDAWTDGVQHAPPLGGSVAGVWGEAGVTVPPSAASFHHDGPRYETATLIGGGGMGRVSAARDRVLRREVARKDLVPGAPAGAGERLAREARITAQLEHPGIVAVYDAGTHPDGSPWYSMRLIRGRTLADVLGEKTLDERPGLLRSVLAACQAVAFAHARGVIHRDLKPENILVGAFGETQVIDWGLACFIDDPILAENGPTGTPAYMSPEQVRGEPADRRSDVWSLGAILYAVATGRWPFDGMDAERTLAARRARGGAVLPPVGAPPALAAIALRALAAEPDERYPDAAALAIDLERYLDGRRVLAHSYSMREVATDLVRAWRAPLVVGGIALLALAIVGSSGWIRNSREGARAQRAEIAALAAQQSATTHLGQALVSHARSAAAAGDRIRAEALAVAALVGGESPLARGVLVAVDEGWRPERLGSGPVLDCERFGVGLNDDYTCQKSGTVKVLGPGGQLVRSAELPGHVPDEPAEFSSVLPDGRLLTWTRAGTWLEQPIDPPGMPRRVDFPEDFFPLWVASDPAGGRVLVGHGLFWFMLELGDLSWSTLEPCPPNTRGRSPLWLPDQLLLLCTNNTVATARQTRGGWHFEHQRLDPSIRAPGVLAPLGSDGLLVGTHHGALALVDRRTLEVRSSVHVVSPSIQALAGSTVSGWVAARSETGAVQLWRPGDTSVVLLPTTARLVGFDSIGDLVAFGDRREVWRFPAHPAPRAVSAEVGLASLGLSPSGDIAVAGCGDGRAAVWEISTGAVDMVEVWAGSVVKDIAFSPDGRGFGAGVAGPHPIAWFDSPHRARSSLGAAGPTRRLVGLAGGDLMQASWGLSGPGIVDVSTGQERSLGWPGRFHDLAAAPSGERIALADESGLLTAEWRDGAWVPTRLPQLAPGYLAVANDGSVAATVATETLESAGFVVGADGNLEIELLPAGLRGTSVALSPDGALVAIGDLGGSVRIWDRATGQLLAELQAHREQVSDLAFRSDRELVSVSWDGMIKRWYLDTLHLPPEQLLSAAGGWSVSLEEALSGGMR